MKELRVDFVYDHGHGWLIVPIETLLEIGCQNLISKYSYIRGEMTFLEEDCDAMRFIKAAKDKGIKVIIAKEFEDVNFRNRGNIIFSIEKLK